MKQRWRYGRASYRIPDEVIPTHESEIVSLESYRLVQTFCGTHHYLKTAGPPSGSDSDCTITENWPASPCSAIPQTIGALRMRSAVRLQMVCSLGAWSCSTRCRGTVKAGLSGIVSGGCEELGWRAWLRSPILYRDGRATVVWYDADTSALCFRP
jgi:hypothetical protein